mmetsp:Transcript_29631/g.81528  ORF Transcript_29631/g.81528 Transcript_29631/m.81528 type:complete len:81 (+) Transcript_29631:60-302(+)
MAMAGRFQDSLTGGLRMQVKLPYRYTHLTSLLPNTAVMPVLLVQRQGSGLLPEQSLLPVSECSCAGDATSINAESYTHVD